MIKQLIEFGIRHPWLIWGFCLSVAGWLLLESVWILLWSRFLSPVKLSLWLTRGTVQLLDLRAQADFEAKHISQSQRMPEQQWEAFCKALNADKPVVFITESDKPAFPLLYYLRAAGYHQLYHLERVV